MIDARQRLRLPSGASSTYYSLPQLEKNSCSRSSNTLRKRIDERRDDG